MGDSVERLKTFPWKLTRIYAFQQFVLLFILLAISTFLFLQVIKQTSLSVEQVEEVKTLALELGVLTIFIFISFTSYVSFKFFRPIGGLRDKLNWILHPEVNSKAKENEPFEPEELGEFYDIESLVDKLEQELIESRERIGRGEMEINTVMGAVSDAMLAVDVTGRAIFFNARFALAFGVTGQGNKGRRLAELLRDPKVVDAFTKSTSEITSQRVSFSYSLPNEEKVFHYVLSVSPLKDRETDALFGAFGLFHDVTDLKNVERMRREFVENASHELRTPLTCIKGYVDTMLEDAKDQSSEQNKYLDIISKNVQRLEFIVNDMMELASLDLGKSLNFSDINLKDLTQSILDQLRVKAKAKDSILSYETKVENLHGDRAKVEQVLVNLIDNAIKYCPRSANILVVWEQDSSGGILLKVRDNGPGIDKKHQDHLFERFYRVDAARTEDVEGSGLGLSIIKHIMQSHGGNVAIKSEIGKGCEFSCYFPDKEPLGSDLNFIG
jgi:two-component system, OmpR family, phosphate regulon sensor histidine kinase PhoR